MSRPIRIEHLCKGFGHALAVDDVSLVAEAGLITTLLGPSGCGKTTTLRCVSGLETPSAGEIAFGDQIVFSGARHIDIPTEHRGIGMMFQNYGLWPHMTVAENVAFALKVRRLSRAEIGLRVQRALDMVQLRLRADAYPGQMSGGQQQRVALARALAYDPEVLLLDEPLANLDAKLREEMQYELLEVQARTGLTALYVTHDQAEAMTLSAKIVVMQDGRIADEGTPQAIYERPRSRFVAEFIGAGNFIAVSGLAALGDGVVGDTALGRLASRRTVEGGVACFMIRPEDVDIAAEPCGDAPNQVPARVLSRVYQGDSIVLLAEAAGGQVLRAHVRRSHPAQPGDAVIARLPAECLIGLAA